MQSFISCYFCRRLLSRFLSRLRPVNTSHSLLVSSTNLSFSYVALSSFFSPRVSLSPSPLLFVQSTYSSLANRQRRNGRVIRSYLEKVWNLQIPPILFQVSLSIVLICLFSFDRFNLLLYYCFFFFSTNSSARVDQSRRKKKKKRKITFDRSFSPVVSVIPRSFRICF